jgi:hypothetical protein
VAELDGRWVALVGWGAAAFKSRHRDQWIGWDESLRWGRLKLIANNVRYLILPGVNIPNLASKVLGMNTRRLSEDWLKVYCHPVLAAETFVDQSRYHGTCYRAAGWKELGETLGYGRNGGKYYLHGKPKTIFVKSLQKDALRLLSDPMPHPELLSREPAMNISACNLEGLFDYLNDVTDPRKKRGIRHNMLSVLAISVCGVLSGARSFLAISDWAESCSQKIMERLNCRWKDGRYIPPSEPTIRRMLKSIDADEVDRAVYAWLRSHSSDSEVIAIDGKTLRGADRVHLVSAILHQEGIVIAQEAVKEKSNEIPALRSMLKDKDIEGCIITADAMHTQKETARFIVQDKKADYVFTVKDNQKNLLDDIKALDLESIPPCI